MGNMENILELATAKLKEKYGNDFQFEEGDEFVFTLNNGVLIILYEDLTLKIKTLLDNPIALDADFSLHGGESDD